MLRYWDDGPTAELLLIGDSMSRIWMRVTIHDRSRSRDVLVTLTWLKFINVSDMLTRRSYRLSDIKEPNCLLNSVGTDKKLAKEW